MATFELEESSFSGYMDDDTIVTAVVSAVKIQEKPYVDDDGTKVKKVVFKFAVDEPNNDHDGQTVYGETPMRFNNHPDCAEGGTQVVPIGRLLGVSRSLHEGPAVDLVVRSGERFTVTMNHPVLTPAGWKAAGRLTEGDQVVHRAGGDGAEFDPNFEQVPIAIEDVFDAMAAVGVHSRIPAATSHFHGDGRFRQGDVDVVRPEGELWDMLNGSFSEQGRELLLVGASAGTLSLAGQGAEDLALAAHGHSSTGGMGRTGHGGVLVASAHLDSGLQEAFSQSAWADGQVLRDLANGLTGLVSLDEIVKVRQVDRFAAHVYNLHTSAGMYLAAGTVVHNCKLANWSREILAAELPVGYRLDTDMLVSQRCRIVVGLREYQKDGETKQTNFVKDVMRSRDAMAGVGAGAIDEPFRE